MTAWKRQKIGLSTRAQLTLFHQSFEVEDVDGHVTILASRPLYYLIWREYVEVEAVIAHIHFVR
jgi:hypothetical protein